MRFFLFLFISLLLISMAHAAKDIKGEFGYRFGKPPATRGLKSVAKPHVIGLDKFAHVYRFSPKRGKLPGQFRYRMFLSHRSRSLYKLQALETHNDKSRCQDAKLNLAQFLANKYSSKVETFEVPSISQIRFQIIPLGENNNITLDCIVAKREGSQIFVYQLVVTYFNHTAKTMAERERPRS